MLDVIRDERRRERELSRSFSRSPSRSSSVDPGRSAGPGGEPRRSRSRSPLARSPPSSTATRSSPARRPYVPRAASASRSEDGEDLRSTARYSDISDEEETLHETQPESATQAQNKAAAMDTESAEMTFSAHAMAQCKARMIQKFMQDCVKRGDVPSRNERVELFAIMFDDDTVRKALRDDIAKGVVNKDGSLKTSAADPEPDSVERSEYKKKEG